MNLQSGIWNVEIIKTWKKHTQNQDRTTKAKHTQTEIRKRTYHGFGSPGC